MAVAATLAAGPASAADLPGGGRVTVVGPECRVRAEGPVDCDPVTSVRALLFERIDVQLVVDAGTVPLTLRTAPGVTWGSMGFIPVTRRSRGRHGDDALPWAAAARPDDATILGRVAESFAPDPGPGTVTVAPGTRHAIWIAVRVTTQPSGRLPLLDDPPGIAELELEVLRTPMPAPVVSFFAYVERDELDRQGDGAEGYLQARSTLRDHGVLAVTRATTVPELADQTEPGPVLPLPWMVERDLVVLGAYGTLGEPAADSLERVTAMAAAVPPGVRDVVLYAVDEDCGSDLGPRWRAALGARGGAASRVKVLVTCSDDPRGLDVDVVMTTAERFRPGLAAAARAAGKEVWVYNGRLPQAGPMALDAPPESLVWNGWIAARHDVRRWFLWNTNHWSDGNRGGHGPRDVYADPETFHNADGDAVLHDGLLLFPGTSTTPAWSWGERPTRRLVLPGARLARLGRGIQDAGLLALAGTLEPAVAAEALDLVVPRALGDVSDDEPVRFGDARAIARARGMLHDVIARGVDAGRLPPGSPEPGIGDVGAPPPTHPGLVAVRTAVALRHARATTLELASDTRPRPARVIAAGAAVAACLVAVGIGARRLARRRHRA